MVVSSKRLLIITAACIGLCLQTTNAQDTNTNYLRVLSSVSFPRSKELQTPIVERLNRAIARLENISLVKSAQGPHANAVNEAASAGCDIAVLLYFEGQAPRPNMRWEIREALTGELLATQEKLAQTQDLINLELFLFAELTQSLSQLQMPSHHITVKALPETKFYLGGVLLGSCDESGVLQLDVRLPVTERWRAVKAGYQTQSGSLGLIKNGTVFSITQKPIRNLIISAGLRDSFQPSVQVWYSFFQDRLFARASLHQRGIGFLFSENGVLAEMKGQQIRIEPALAFGGFILSDDYELRPYALIEGTFSFGAAGFVPMMGIAAGLTWKLNEDFELVQEVGATIAFGSSSATSIPAGLVLPRSMPLSQEAALQAPVLLLALRWRPDFSALSTKKAPLSSPLAND